ncbi:MAG: PEGA domain-containing protein [Polyangiaceae bacterium]
MRSERRARHRTLTIYVSTFLVLELFVGPTHAESTLGAREHFERGVELAQHGDIEAAAQEFEAAYQISPNYSVLYNLGQSYAALGKPVEAVRAFERYLEIGGAKIARSRRSQVEAAISLNRRHIGFVSLSVDPPSASVAVDGRSLSNETPMGQLALATGEHGLTAIAPGYEPFIGMVQVTSGNSVPFRVQMTPVALPPAALGQLSVACAIPDVGTKIDGAVVKPHLSDPLLVSIGRHEVSFERRGYLTERTITGVSEGTVSQVTCALRRAPNLSTNDAGFLAFDVAPPGARIQIDGVPESSTVRVPTGSHDVLIRHADFEDWHQLVVARPRFPRVIHVLLKPTAEHALNLRARATSRRTWQYALAGAGASLAAASLALVISSDQRYASWDRDRERFANDFQSLPSDPAWLQRASELQGRAASIQRQDDLAVGFGILGAGLLVSSLVSWLTDH